jgi:hypothetical protein
MPKQPELEVQILRLANARGVRYSDLARAIRMTDGAFQRALACRTLTPQDIKRIERALQAPPGWRRMKTRELPRDRIALTAVLTPAEKRKNAETRKLMRPVIARARKAAKEMQDILQILDRTDIPPRSALDRLDAVKEEFKHVETGARFIARRRKVIGKR